jgi:hypothetical protein
VKAATGCFGESHCASLCTMCWPIHPQRIEKGRTTYPAVGLTFLLVQGDAAVTKNAVPCLGQLLGAFNHADWPSAARPFGMLLRWVTLGIL